jgi:DNA-binding NtrC family response regulator
LPASGGDEPTSRGIVRTVVDSEQTLPSRVSGVPVCAIRVQVTSGPDAGKSAIADDALSIGTAEGNDLTLTDRTVSRYHVEIRREGDALIVSDVGSTNGTEIGAVSFRASSVRVCPGIALSLGQTRISLDDGEVRIAQAPPRASVPGLIGSSLSMRRLAASVSALAQQQVPILVLGESGTGKERIARALHELGPRADRELVVVDCGALAPSLLASELFGHERGAFTGADRRHAGAFERAHGGTIFLDEIGELPMEQQTMLLGVLERRQIRRLGGAQDIPIDVRVIAATHRDLRAAVNEGRFRLDLYYRIAVVRLEAPPLRARTDDLPELIEHFLREEGIEAPAFFTPHVVQRLEAHSWPGNVRELRNVVLATLATGSLSLDGVETTPIAPAEAAPIQGSYREARARVLEHFEREFLSALLAQTNGNIREAARQARMDRTHLMDLMRRHGMR